MASTTRERRDRATLRRCVERIVADACGAGSAVRSVRRERDTLSTSYDTYRLTARLASGRVLGIFLKDFGRSVRPKDDARQRREREIRVYRELLADAALGTARYYGSLCDESRGRYWLFLELVRGTPVGYCDLESWTPALVALGRMHGHFAARADRLTVHDFLIRYDASLFWSKAELAAGAVAHVAPRLARRFASLVRRYGPAVDVMASQPPTLMHGGCRGTNILVRIADEPSRVCLLDWEEAGIGAPLCDIAWLIDGVQPPVRDRLLDAYRREALACGLPLPAPGDTDRVLDCFHLHMTMNSLSRAILKGYRDTDVAKLVAIAEQVGRGVLGRRSEASRARASTPEARVGPTRGAESMTVTGRASAARADEGSLERVLERVLRDAHGAPVRVADVRREPSPFTTLFPAEVLHATLESGEHRSLFVKHLGPEQSDHPEKQRRDREVCVYEILLAERHLPVVGYHGCRRNAETGRCELFLEYVDAWNLRYHDLREWWHAAQRLGELHAHFAARAERLSACDFLLRLDASYFREWPPRAIAVAARHSAELAAHLHSVANEYERVACLLGSQPSTLVHNDLSPKNVIADRSSTPSRICFVDWEMAGIGCGLLDLVTLKYGLQPEADEMMCAAYRAAVAEAGLLPAHPREVARLFAACELHKTLYRIAFSDAWKVPAGRVALWVSEARRLCARV